MIGLNTLPLAGLPVNSDPVILRGVNGATIHITSGAQIADAHVNSILRLLLEDHPGETSYTLLASPEAPRRITVEGAELPQVDNIETVEQGWQWLAAHHTAVVKICFASRAVSLTCAYAE